MGTLIIVIAAAGLLIAGEAAALFLLVRHQRSTDGTYQDISSRLEDVEDILSHVSEHVGRLIQPAQPAPSGLEPGTPAPAFALPDLAGRERRLEEFRGKPLLLAFFSTTCGYCQQMAPRLGELPEDGPRVLLISRGDVDEHLQLAAEHKWRCDVVLEQGTENLTAYKATGTPTGYLIDAEGRIASELAVGADALLALTVVKPDDGASPDDLTMESLRQKEADAAERARAAGLGIRASTLQRDGLRAGTTAPDFKLEDLDGHEHRLADFRDKRVLLVFSEPACGPCEALAPELVQLQQRHTGNNLQILMVSRGEPALVATKAKQHGFNFPVLLQKQWEVSKKYAMFATPVGYLIDEKGVIQKDVAVGKSAILELI